MNSYLNLSAGAREKRWKVSEGKGLTQVVGETSARRVAHNFSSHPHRLVSLSVNVPQLTFIYVLYYDRDNNIFESYNTASSRELPHHIGTRWEF